MNLSVKINAFWAWAIFIIFTEVVNSLVFATAHFNLPKALLGFVWLFLLPGWLLTRIIKLPTENAWEKLGFTAGFSILLVIATTLLVNTLLPILGYKYPLDTTTLLLGLDTAWLGLFTAAWWRQRHQPLVLRIPKLSTRDWLVSLAGLSTVVMAILGAVSLNNGGGNGITWFMLAFTAGYFGVLIAIREKLRESALLTGIYFVGLALLLMTSLRGWYITGHDIQAEFRVFTLALANLDWSMTNFNDAYNACLSITILPTVIYQVMGVSEVYVFKTVFQALFALVPVLVYLIARRHTSRLIALLATIYFLAFPTFFGDMPMLNRQEIAFLFIGLIFLTTFNHHWSRNRRRWLISIFGAGVVVSHYSTTYTMIGIFVLVVLLRLGLKLAATLAGPRPGRIRGFLSQWRHPARAPVNLWIVTILMIASYIWTTQITGTGNNITRVVTETIQGVHKGLFGNSRSSDTNYSLLGKASITDQQRLNTALGLAVSEARAQSTDEELYPVVAYAGYKPVIVSQNELALTPAGQLLKATGINVPALNSAMRQGSAILLQVLLVAGILVLLINRAVTRRRSSEYRLFQVTSVFLLAAIVLLPVLSAEYGLLRAFQQVLILSGSAIAVATVVVIPARYRRARILIPSILAIGFFLSSTGVITTLLGGYPAQLHLANSGKYYDLYYTHTTEERAAKWLVNSNDHQTHLSVFADRPTFGKIQDFTDIGREGDINPGVMLRDYYAFLGYTNLTKQEATITYNGDPLSYRYPIKFLDDNKDLVYSSRGARIYR